MKQILFRSLVAWGCAFLITMVVRAEEPAYTSVLAKEGITYGVAGDKLEPLIKEITFASNILINTNGTFKVGKEGKERTLTDGEKLSNDGRLTKADGTIQPVEDHVTRGGREVTVVRDGVATTLTSPLKLGDGTVVMPDGWLVKDGRKSYFVEGQIIKLSGATIPAVDTATIVNGQVVVQKDGGQFKIDPRSSITMNDGTRVFGNGTVRKPDGKEVKLKEGEIMRIEGVAIK